MAETQATTDVVQRLAPLRTILILDELDTYPYTVSYSNVVALSIYNFSLSDALTLTVNLEDTSTFTVTVPASVPYSAEFESNITSVDVAGTTPDFNLEMRRRKV